MGVLDWRAMFRWLLPLALLAGCLAEAPAAAPEPAASAEPVVEPLVPDAWQLRPFADAEAKEWNPGAKLILVAAFEGDIPVFDSAIPNADPWAGPFRGKDSSLADGRSPLWSFSYAVDDLVSDVATDVCDAGQHGEIREAHVVTVDATGRVVAAYETRDDDEGSAQSGFLPDGLVGSADAALAADADLRRFRERSTYARTFLMAEWYTTQPSWVFLLEGEDDAYGVAVDATTGKVVEPSSGPRC